MDVLETQAVIAEEPVATEPSDKRINESSAMDRNADTNWPSLLSKLGLNGITLTLASNCYLARFEDDKMLLVLEPGQSSLCNETQIERIEEALTQFHGRTVDVTIEIGEQAGPTPAMIAEQLKLQMMQEAEREIESDDNVKSLIAGFGARVVQGTISPIGKQGDQGK